MVLLRTFTDIQSAAGEHNYDRLRDKLAAFQRVLDQHLLEENVRLYVFLQKCLEGDSDSRELVDNMKREMGQIGRAVRDFIRHYKEHGVNDDNVVKFTSELEQIGATLTDRIEREENSLYTLYMPPDNFN